MYSRTVLSAPANCLPSREPRFAPRTDKAIKPIERDANYRQCTVMVTNIGLLSLTSMLDDLPDRVSVPLS